MLLTNWLSSLANRLRQSNGHKRRARRNYRSLQRQQADSSMQTVSAVAAEGLEVRALLAGDPIDFGDAPDTTAGTGAGDYQTINANGGPSHVIVSGLFLGNSVDPDGGLLQNARANADDTNEALPDDEDGVLSPLDLQGTIGAGPTVTLLATNTTGSAATLSGWIDYNNDGVFDNATERAQATVADSTTDGRFTLTFPAVPSGFTGTTYARFRLSTDAAAANSTGAASDGEVEDYTFAITSPSDGSVKQTVEINDSIANGPTLSNYDRFGTSVASLGDLDGDGVSDLAVGAERDDEGGTDRGAVHVLLLNADGSVKQTVEINSGTANGPTLSNYDSFGSSVTSLGDLDGDGIGDLAVGAQYDDAGGGGRGAVHVLLLNADGSVKQTVEINSSSPNGPTLSDNDLFGNSVTSVGDLDGDGVPDLAVGAFADDAGGSYRGAVHVLLLNADGSVKSTVEINSTTTNGPTLDNYDYFGSSVAALGDLDGDGIVDLAVGAPRDDAGGRERGAVHVLLLNADGSVKSTVEINSTTTNGPTLGNFPYFGSSVATVGDLDGDGIGDLAVGAQYDDAEGGPRRGAVHVLLLNADGSVKSTIEINSTTTNGPTLDNYDRFGRSVAALGDLDGDGIIDLAVGAQYDDNGRYDFYNRGAVHIIQLAPPPPPVDYGDAPDTSAGTGAGDYQTTTANGGPSHTVVAGLFLGDTVDGSEDGTLQNARANADDTADALPDDEDGVLSPLDLLGTIGAAPTVTLLATNTTGSAATLFGWIDYNNDGVFDNATERAQATVADSTTDGRFTLTFPAIPEGFTGETYARFRLSTDAAAANSTGAASDGEVEDYTFAITSPSDGSVKQTVEINSSTANGPTLTNDDRFGSSVASLGDLDGDGVNDLAVGAIGDDASGYNHGAVHVLLLNSGGSVKQTVKINSSTANGPTLSNYDNFGYSVTSLGDLDGDGVTDLAVGASSDKEGGYNRGAVHVLLLNADASVKQTVEINSSTANGPTLSDRDRFGSSVTSLGDLDGDGVNDLAVGAEGDDAGGINRGAVHVLLLNSDGSVKQTVEINSSTANGPTLSNSDYFGSSVASLGDLDGDGVNDLAVGARRDNEGSIFRGAVHVLLLNADGSVKQTVEINSSTANGPTLSNFDEFGRSVTSLGDLDGDGVTDLVVGAYGDSAGGSYRGAVHVLLLNSDGSVKQTVEINSSTANGPTLSNYDNFGTSVTSLGDLDGDGVNDLAVGARSDDEGGSNRGAVHVLSLAPPPPPPPVDFGDAPDTSAGTGAGDYQTTAANGGPSHTVVAGLFLGDTVDGSEDGTLQNARANADDTADALPDDEDGVLSPLDLLGTIGAAPTVTLLATNTTGSAATLFGWIDYNNDGVFDNATERAQATVADSTTDGRFTLTFPAIPEGFTGETYARFRLSTDAAAANSTGAASDGEVEDYTFAITSPSDGSVKQTVEINSSTANGPTLTNDDRFGSSVASLGDLDGDGVNDLAVGARGDDASGYNHGAVHVLLLNSGGSVKQTVKINSSTANGPTLSNNDYFGSSVASLGDLDGDGVTDLAVGARFDNEDGYYRGAVHVLLLNADASVKQTVEINSSTANGPTLSDRDNFGTSVASLGDLDGDGVNDLAVGAELDDAGGSNRGAVHVLLLNSDGSVKQTVEINSSTANGPTLSNFDHFGYSVTALGDLDGDGVNDLAVGAIFDNEGGYYRGAVHVLLLNSDASVKQTVEINSSTANGPTLSNGDHFGNSVTSLGDLDGDGVTDLVVGAKGDSAGGSYRGAVHVLLLNSDGSVKQTVEINSSTANGPTLSDRDNFGTSVASLGDLDGDGVNDLAVGAIGDDEGGSNRGAVHILSLAPPPPTLELSVSHGAGTEAGTTAITITATASAAVSGNQTVDLVVTGTGVTSDDYTLSASQITINDGQTTGFVTFTVKDDSLAEGEETATLTISGPSAGITLGSTVSQNVVITDNDTPKVNLSVSPISGTESAATAITVTATADAPVVGDQTVDLAVTGTGISSDDYDLSNTKITISNGETSGTVTFTIQDDNVVEALETAILTISNPTSGLQLGSTLSRDIQILNDDSATVSVTDVVLDEGTGGSTTATFTVTLSAPVGAPVTLLANTADDTATSNSDYTAVINETVSFAPNSTTSQEVDVTITTDSVLEADELFDVVLSDLAANGLPVTFLSGGATETATAVLRNDDFPAGGPGPVIDHHLTDAYATIGTWSTFGNKLNLKDGDFQLASAGSGEQVAAWAFTDLTPGQFRVSVSYRAWINRATNAPFTLRDGLAVLPLVRVNQQVAPSDLTEDGITFHDLGNFNVQGNRLEVTLSNDADGIVVADAVRVERIGDLVTGPEIHVTVDGGDLFDGDTIDIGNIEQDDSGSRTITVTNLGTEDLVLSEPINVPAGFSLISTFGSTTLAPLTSTTFELGVDTATLGSKSSAVSFGTNDTTDDENPFNFTIQANVIPDSGIQIIDNGDSGFSTTGSWTSVTGNLKGHENDFHYASGGTGANTATWTFDVVPGQYQVAATWKTHTNRATDAPFTIFNGGFEILTTTVDQSVAAAGVNDAGSSFTSLGMFNISGNTLTVTLTDNATGLVIADAVRIQRMGDIPVGPEIVVTDGGADVADGSGVVDFGNVETGDTAIKTLTVYNFGTQDLNLSDFASSSTGFTITNPGTTVVAPNASTTFDVEMDTSTITALTGTVSFTSNDADESAYDFTVRGNVTPVSTVQVIDDGDVGFTKTGTWTQLFTPNGHDSDFHWAYGSNAETETARWAFDISAAGPGQYRVSVHWKEHTNRASDARYTLNDAGNSVVNLNQLVAPDLTNGIQENGSVFEDLGLFNFQGSSVEVTLSNLTADSGAIVVADAVRIERVGDLP